MGNVEMEGNWEDIRQHSEHSEHRHSHIIHDTRHTGFIELLLSEGKPWWW